MNSSGGEGASSRIATAARAARRVAARARQALAEGAVADLVVVLEEVDEGAWAAGARSARRARGRRDSCEARPGSEALGEAAAQQLARLARR